jgi:hypothetical protein
LASATSGPSGSTIQGVLNSTPDTAFLVDFYAIDAVDPSGNGEGQAYLGTKSVITNAGGNASFNATFPVVLGNHVTATATNAEAAPAGDTSEFSTAVTMTGRGAFRFSRAGYTVNENAGTATITVQRVGGTSGAVSVRFTTVDGTAKAPGDYAARSLTLTFEDDQATRTVTVPIVNDSRDEATETINLKLTNPGGGATLSRPKTATLSIVDNDS